MSVLLQQHGQRCQNLGWEGNQARHRRLSCVQVSAELYWSTVPSPWWQHPPGQHQRPSKESLRVRDPDSASGSDPGGQINPSCPSQAEAPALALTPRPPSLLRCCSPRLPAWLGREPASAPRCGLLPPCSLLALPVPNCGRGRQEGQAVLRLRLPVKGSRRLLPTGLGPCPKRAWNARRPRQGDEDPPPFPFLQLLSCSCLNTVQSASPGEARGP